MIIIYTVLTGSHYTEGLKFQEKELIFDQNKRRIGYIKKYTVEKYIRLRRTT